MSRRSPKLTRDCRKLACKSHHSEDGFGRVDSAVAEFAEESVADDRTKEAAGANVEAGQHKQSAVKNRPIKSKGAFDLLSKMVLSNGVCEQSAVNNGPTRTTGNLLPKTDP
jgi:hypothetical protein